MKKRFATLAVILIVIASTVLGCSKESAASPQKESVNKAEEQKAPAENQFDATVLEIYEEYLLVEALEGQNVAGEVKVWIGLLDKGEVSEVRVSDTVRITHDGKMTMSIPPQMSAVELIEI